MDPRTAFIEERVCAGGGPPRVRQVTEALLDQQRHSLFSQNKRMDLIFGTLNASRGTLGSLKMACGSRPTRRDRVPS